MTGQIAISHPARLLPFLFLLSCCTDAFSIHRASSTCSRNDVQLRNIQRSRLAMSTIEGAAEREHQPPKRVAIAGAGIIGTSTAYYLAQNHDITAITLINVTGQVAPAASGKAGGFLALDWNDGTATGPLTRRSFALHQELSDRFGADTIQYRRLTCAAISASTSGVKPKAAKLRTVEWATGGANVRSLGDESTIAQVHPRLLAEALGNNTPGGTLVQGRVVGEAIDPDTGKFRGALLADGSVVDADALIYCCGPWSANIMLGVKYHSVVVPTTRVLSQSVFFQGHGDPEVYVRPDQTAYCTGFPEPARTVTEAPGQEQVQPDRIEAILNAVKACGGGGGDGNNELNLDRDNEAVIQQACYLPTTDDGLPIMGQLDGKENVYVAAGHSCWGILLGPATGECMASLVATGKSTNAINLAPFRPQRYPQMALVPNNVLGVS
jgi:glycine/D-amino acid oxidase-like deaminating enzyme